MCPGGRKRGVCRVPDRCPIKNESNTRCVCQERTCPRRSGACLEVCEAVGHTPDNLEEKVEARVAPVLFPHAQNGAHEGARAPDFEEPPTRGARTERGRLREEVEARCKDSQGLGVIPLPCGAVRYHRSDGSGWGGGICLRSNGGGRGSSDERRRGNETNCSKFGSVHFSRWWPIGRRPSATDSGCSEDGRSGRSLSGYHCGSGEGAASCSPVL